MELNTALLERRRRLCNAAADKNLAKEKRTLTLWCVSTAVLALIWHRSLEEDDDDEGLHPFDEGLHPFDEEEGAHHRMLKGDDFDDAQILALDDKQRAKLCPEDLGMFNMVDGAVSFKVVNCFLGIIIFQVCSENVLESLEAVAHGSVYGKFIEKSL